jgi:tetratricopeptide (TPR) repeat protein
VSGQAKAATHVDWRRHALPMLALWAFALLAYSNSFRAGFVFDNERAILRDSRVHAATSENLHLILNQEYWYKSTVSLLYRPLTTFSYLLNYAIFGNGPDPAGYHWVNFALHAVNIALVYLLGLLLFQETKPKEHLALALAAVWAVHPVLTESVTNIVGRADLLAGFGVLAGLLCHAKGAVAAGRRRVAWLAGLMAAATIGMFSKESAVVLLAVMAIYDFTVGRGGAPRRPAGVRKPEVPARQARGPNATYSFQNLESGKNCGAGLQGYPLGPAGWEPGRIVCKQNDQRRLKTGAQDAILPHNPGMVSGMPKSMWHWARVPAPHPYIAAAVPVAIFLYVRSRVLAGLAVAPVAFTDNPLVGAGFWTARLTAVKVIGKYLWLLVWPRNLSCDYSYNQIPVAGSFAALAVCAAAAAAAILCYRRHKAVCFFIAFFFAALAPTSNLVIFIGSVMAERFLYLPSVGFAGCLVWAVYRRPRIAPAVLVLISAALALRTYARNIDWLDDQSLWTSAAQVCPASYKTHLHVATGVIGPQGEGMDRAIGEVNRSLAILDGLPDDRNVPQAYSTAGLIYIMQGELLAAKGSGAQSQQWYRKALDVLLRGEKVDRTAAQEVRRENQLRGIRISPSGWDPLYLALGDAYLRLSDPRKAMEAFEYGRTLRPAPEFFEDMSDTWRVMGDPRQAAIVLIEGLLVDQSNTKLASDLVKLYRQTAPGSCAVSDAGGALSLNPACPLVHDQVCTAFRNVRQLYMQMGQEPMAVSTGRRAVSEAGCPALESSPR